MMNAKKLLALVLALMLCAAVLPAVAENSEAQAAAQAAAEELAAATAEKAAFYAEQNAADAQTEEVAAESLDPATVLATVNGTEITLDRVSTIANELIDSYSSQGYDMTNEQNLTIVRQIAMRYAIQYAVMDQMVEQFGLTLTEEEIAAMTEELAASWEETIASLTETILGDAEDPTDEEKAGARAEALAYAESVGYSFETILDEMLANAAYSKLYETLVANVTVSDEDIRAAFDARVAEDQANYADNIYYYELYTKYYSADSFYTPEGYRGITQILLPVDDELLNAYTELSEKLASQQAAEGEEAQSEEEPVTQEQVDAAYAAAIDSIQATYDEIIEKYNGGTAFEDLMDQYGIDPGMTVEPNRTLGYNVHRESVLWDPAFVEASFSIDNIGDVSKPYLGSYGAYVVRYTRDVPGGAVEFTEEIAASLRDEAIASAQDDLFGQIVSSEIDNAVIEYSEAGQPYVMTEE